MRQWLTALQLVLLASCGSSGRPMPEVVEEANATLVGFGLLPGDLLSVRFRHKSEWDHDVRVRPDGSASFFLLGDVPVQGLKPEDMEEFLVDKYAGLLTSDPELSVLVQELGPREIFVMGEVEEPGALAVPGQQLTFFEAMARAGGPLKATAQLDCILLIRSFSHSQVGLAQGVAKLMTSPTQLVVWEIDADRDYWVSGPALMVQPGDVIFVPNTAIDEVDIWVDQYIRQLIPLPNIGVY